MYRPSADGFGFSVKKSLESMKNNNFILKEQGRSLSFPVYQGKPAEQVERQICPYTNSLNVNFQSVDGKRAGLHCLVDNINPDIILGTET